MGRECVNSTRNWFSDLVKDWGLELLTLDSFCSRLLNWEQFWWMQLFFQLHLSPTFSSVFCSYPFPISSAHKCIIECEKKKKGYYYLKLLSVSQNSFTFSYTYLYPRLPLWGQTWTKKIGQPWPYLVSSIPKYFLTSNKVHYHLNFFQSYFSFFQWSSNMIFFALFKCF